jgi:hypothetical protein
LGEGKTSKTIFLFYNEKNKMNKKLHRSGHA